MMKGHSVASGTELPLTARCWPDLYQLPCTRFGPGQYQPRHASPRLFAIMAKRFPFNMQSRTLGARMQRRRLGDSGPAFPTTAARTSRRCAGEGGIPSSSGRQALHKSGRAERALASELRTAASSTEGEFSMRRRSASVPSARAVIGWPWFVSAVADATRAASASPALSACRRTPLPRDAPRRSSHLRLPRVSPVATCVHGVLPSHVRSIAAMEPSESP